MGGRGTDKGKIAEVRPSKPIVPSYFFLWTVRASRGFKQGADIITCQSEDDSSKNVENRVRWIAQIAGRIGQERSD